MVGDKGCAHEEEGCRGRGRSCRGVTAAQGQGVTGNEGLASDKNQVGGLDGCNDAQKGRPMSLKDRKGWERPIDMAGCSMECRGGTDGRRPGSAGTVRPGCSKPWDGNYCNKKVQRGTDVPCGLESQQ